MIVIIDMWLWQFVTYFSSNISKQTREFLWRNISEHTGELEELHTSLQAAESQVELLEQVSRLQQCDALDTS